MASIKITLRKKPNKDGSYPLSLRITKDRRSTYIYLGKNVELQEWDEDKRRVRRNHPNSKRMNNYLLSRLTHSNSVLFDLESGNEDFSLNMIKDRITRKAKTETFFAQAELYFETLWNAGNFNRHSAERPAINHMRRFLRGRDIEFRDITRQLLEQFKAYLLGEVHVSQRTAVNHLIIIRTLYKRAISNDIVDAVHYPFGRNGLQLRKPESEKIGWEKEEVRLLEQLDVSHHPHMQHAKNLWLFSFYFAGMRAADIFQLQWSAFKNGRLHYTMGKNLKVGSVVVPAKGQSILNRYKTREISTHNLVFPDLETVQDLSDKIAVQRRIKHRLKKVNKYLKRMATMLDIDKKLTMHIARHTFGNISGDKIPIQKLQMLYRHSSILTTLGYQKAFLNKGTDDALEAVLDF